MIAMGPVGRARARRRWAVALCLTLLVWVPRSGRSDDGEAATWRFETALYAWVPGIHGTIGVAGQTARLDVTPVDLLKSVFDGDALAAAGYFSVRRGRWSLFADVFGGGAKVDVDQQVPTPFCTLAVNAKDRMRFVVADFAIGYRLGRWTLPKRRSPMELGVYAGARYVHLENDLEGGVAVIGGRRFGVEVSDTLDWADPLIGFRVAVPLLDSVTFMFRGDIGGFGASSDLDWGLATDLRYWMSWRPWSAQPYLALGYRVVGLERSSGGADVDLQLRGPTVGLGVVF